MPVVADSLRWHTRGPARGDDAVLNACRSLRYALEGTWSSKPAAARWVVDRVESRETVARALEARAGGPRVDPDEAERFLRAVLAHVRSAS